MRPRRVGPAPYLASEDSALLRTALLPYSGNACLEIGAGNAGNVVELAKRFDLVVGTELQRPAMSDWKDEEANLILADGASALRDSSFDLVAFNPPYIRAEIVDRAVDGGPDLEVPKRFLRDALRVVKGSGKVVFLLSEEAEMDEFERICGASGFRLRKVAAERGFFEELSVYLAARD